MIIVAKFKWFGKLVSEDIFFVKVNDDDGLRHTPRYGLRDTRKAYLIYQQALQIYIDSSTVEYVQSFLQWQIYETYSKWPHVKKKYRSYFDIKERLIKLCQKTMVLLRGLTIL